MTETITETDGSTPRRTFRAPDELWDAYTAVCAAEGTTAAADLRGHMTEKVALPKGRRTRKRAS